MHLHCVAILSYASITSSTASQPNMLPNATLLRPVEHETCCLFVGNAGATVGLPPARIAEVCTFQGVTAPKVDVPDPTKTFLYVTFETVDLARQARKVLMSSKVMGRLLTVKYADLHPKASKVSLKLCSIPLCVARELLSRALLVAEHAECNGASTSSPHFRRSRHSRAPPVPRLLERS